MTRRKDVGLGDTPAGGNGGSYAAQQRQAAATLADEITLLRRKLGASGERFLRATYRSEHWLAMSQQPFPGQEPGIARELRECLDTIEAELQQLREVFASYDDALSRRAETAENSHA